MIVSHRHRYVFVEIPLTASWAVARELRTYYDGEPILHKHATTGELRRHRPDLEGYVAFATVRHPLDVIVSRYSKLVSDPRRHDLPARAATGDADVTELRRYEQLCADGDDFPTYFRRYHRVPYSEMIDLSRRELDRVLRYERLQSDFVELLHAVGLSPVRPLPVLNRTAGKRPFEEMYPPEIRRQAQRVCAPFMEAWGYGFPAGWPPHTASWLDRMTYRGCGWLRRLYMQHVRYRDGVSGRWLRRLRARWAV